MISIDVPATHVQKGQSPRALKDAAREGEWVEEKGSSSIQEQLVPEQAFAAAVWCPAVSGQTQGTFAQALRLGLRAPASPPPPG